MKTILTFALLITAQANAFWDGRGAMDGIANGIHKIVCLQTETEFHETMLKREAVKEFGIERMLQIRQAVHTVLSSPYQQVVKGFEQAPEEFHRVAQELKATPPKQALSEMTKNLTASRAGRVVIACGMIDAMAKPLEVKSCEQALGQSQPDVLQDRVVLAVILCKELVKALDLKNENGELRK